MDDRRLGYTLMFIILLLTAGFAYYFVWLFYTPLETRIFRFTEVGSLAIEDPVRMKGALVGVISGFEHDSLGRVLVYVETPKDFPLFKKKRFPDSIPVRTSSRVAVKVKGVMGERFIEVTMGNPDDPLIPAYQIVDGEFEMGPSEAIAYMDLLHAKITELKDVMLWLRDGKDGGRSFITAFNSVVGTVDTLVYKLLTGMADMEDGLNTGIATAADITNKTVKLTANVAAKTPEVIEDITAIIVKIDDVITKTDTILAKVDRIAGAIDKNKILWGDHAEKIQKALVEIKKEAEAIRENGLPLTIKLKLW